MKTTLKRGMGRGSSGTTAPVQPGRVAPNRAVPPPRRPRRKVAIGRLVAWGAVVIATLGSGIAGGVYLYLDESLSKVVPSTEDVQAAADKLDVALPGAPANALVIGYDRRAEDGDGAPSRSDTLMLVRADPVRGTMSMLSFPRDLRVDIICPGRGTWRDKITNSYSTCGPQGTVETIKQLTGQPVNYLVTVNFRGFRQLIDALGGVWIDIDRRYYNDQGGPNGYATINIQPGYQRLTGLRALDFVRFRHTDSDLFRNARQQLFLRAFNDQVSSAFSLTSLPSLVNVITSNVEVGQGGGTSVSAKTVLSYALFAYSLPRGRVFQSRIGGLEGWSDLTTAPENVKRAVQEFVAPDVNAPRKATRAALGEKGNGKQKAPTARETSVTVLNGNGVSGSASTASFLIGQHGYQMMLPPNGVPANAPTFDFARTKVLFDGRIPAASSAARKLAMLLGEADTAPVTPALRHLANGATLVVVVGHSFTGALGDSPLDQTPTKTAPAVVPGTEASLELLRDARGQVPFPLMVPTVIEQSSWIDREKPIRVYFMDKDRRKHKALRLTHRFSGTNEYWGVQMTDWDDAPALAANTLTRTIGGRRFDLFFSGPRLHMVVLREDDASYWVVNTLLDRISNETMLEIAKGLRPITSIARS